MEFKEAKRNCDTDKIGRYFSAISNEANLRQQQYGWLVFGVTKRVLMLRFLQLVTIGLFHIVV